MRLTIVYSKIKKRNLVLINNHYACTYQRETLSERPIRQLLRRKKSQLWLMLKKLQPELGRED